ncbi:MAG: hypothetical protein R3321_00455 [Nitrososphaeraceae archaeon]|nr:hypothetical protein [Nitrososphaeraceae archaeon]
MSKRLFEKLAPKWTKALDKGKYGPMTYEQEKYKEHLNITDSEKCIIGEIWGFTHKYRSCEKCESISNLGIYKGRKYIKGFIKLNTNMIFGRVKNWRDEKVIKYVEDHIRNDHPELIPK